MWFYASLLSKFIGRIPLESVAGMKWNPWPECSGICKERLLHKKDCPLLSCGDIIALLCHYLPRRDISEKEVFRQMQIRHERRQASIDSAYRKQETEDSH